MTDTTPLTGEQARFLANTVAHVAARTEWVAARGNLELPGGGQYQAMSSRLAAAVDAVYGNRPATAPTTWADARYQLAAVLRGCLDRLDAGATQ